MKCPVCGLEIDSIDEKPVLSHSHLVPCLRKQIENLESELKNQIELHDEWLGTYRIKLYYIEELERKIKRLTT